MPTGGRKIYIGNLNPSTLKQDVEKEFSRFGDLDAVWVAQNPPGFGFVIFKNSRDAEHAIRALDGRRVFGNKLIVEMAKNQDSLSLPRQLPPRRYSPPRSRRFSPVRNFSRRFSPVPYRNGSRRSPYRPRSPRRRDSPRRRSRSPYHSRPNRYTPPPPPPRERTPIRRSRSRSPLYRPRSPSLPPRNSPRRARYSDRPLSSPDFPPRSPLRRYP